jgi:anti-sigma factor ChrR (cupin superfamily)
MNDGSVSHIPEDLLETYAMGRLSGPDCAPLHRHLLLCPSCQTNLKETREYIKVMKAAMADLFLSRTRHNIRKLQHAWVAAVVALLILAIPPYRDNITAVALTAARGAFSLPHARAGHVLLQIDVKEIPQRNGYQLEVVNPKGHPIWHALVELCPRATPD